MKTVMHNAPGYGASPEAVREYDFDLATAHDMLAAMQEIRSDCTALSERVAKQLGPIDLWDSSLDAHDNATKRERFLAALLELVDDFTDQGKLAEAGEIS